MKAHVNLFLMIALAVVMAGCKNTSKTETSGSLVSDSLSISSSTTEAQVNDDIQAKKPFKGRWTLIEKADIDEQSGQSFGRYEVSLDIDFYDKNYENIFWVANDRHEAMNGILSFNIQGNEADIRYESASTAIYSGKLRYNPKDKSMMIINGKLLDKQGMDESIIYDWEILRGDDILKFDGSKLNNGHSKPSPGTLHLEGTLSKSKIKMQLDIQGEEVNGTYCYTKHNTPIILVGKVLDGVYTIDEFNHGNNTGTFTLTPGSNNVWTGYWSNGEKNLPVSIRKQ